MNMNELKREIISRLDRVAHEHPMGHQRRYANRYVLLSSAGLRVELMFQKDEKTPAYLWVKKQFVEELLYNESMNNNLIYKESLSSDLYNVVSNTGKLQYGRHSALSSMPQLVDADLVRFKLRNTSDFERIIETLKILAYRLVDELHRYSLNEIPIVTIEQQTANFNHMHNTKLLDQYARKKVFKNLDNIEKLIVSLTSTLSSIGHNQQPEFLKMLNPISSEKLLELMKTVLETRDLVNMKKHDDVRIYMSTLKLHRFLRKFAYWIKQRLELGIDSAIKSFGAVLGGALAAKAVPEIIECIQMIHNYLTHTFQLLVAWISTLPI